MHTAKTPLKQAQTVTQLLKQYNLIHPEYKIKSDEQYLYVPLSKQPPESVIEKITSIEMDPSFFTKKKETITLQDRLKQIIPDDQWDALTTSFDTIGTIALIEINQKLISKQKEIAQAILQSNPSLQTVAKKIGGHQGTFRIQNIEILAGQSTTTTIHKENGVSIELDVGKVYFSPRLSNERLRIANQITTPENVLVMFSGCGPYICVIAKKTPATTVTGIEINPIGHKFALKNVKRNHLTNVTLYNADVNDISDSLPTYNRIIMPLPRIAGSFLPSAIRVAAPKAIIHLYAFISQQDIAKTQQETIETITKLGRTVHNLTTIRCGQQSPNIYRICMDIQL